MTPLRIRQIVMIKPDTALHLCNFAKLLNYPRASDCEFKRVLRWLEKQELVIKQQGGYLGDNMHHEELVTVLKPFDIEKFKQVILTRVNYIIGNHKLHRSEAKRKCKQCKQQISVGERYGSIVGVAKRGYPRLF